MRKTNTAIAMDQKEQFVVRISLRETMGKGERKGDKERKEESKCRRMDLVANVA